MYFAILSKYTCTQDIELIIFFSDKNAKCKRIINNIFTLNNKQNLLLLLMKRVTRALSLIYIAFSSQKQSAQADRQFCSQYFVTQTMDISGFLGKHRIQNKYK